jgi:hypothetical protein
MKLDPGMHIGMHLVSFGKSGVTFIYYTGKVKVTQLIISALTSYAAPSSSRQLGKIRHLAPSTS